MILIFYRNVMCSLMMCVQNRIFECICIWNMLEYESITIHGCTMYGVRCSTYQCNILTGCTICPNMSFTHPLNRTLYSQRFGQRWATWCTQAKTTKSTNNNNNNLYLYHMHTHANVEAQAQAQEGTGRHTHTANKPTTDGKIKVRQHKFESDFFGV